MTAEMTTQEPTLAEQIELMNSQFYPMIQGGSEYQKAILASLRRLQAIEQDGPKLNNETPGLARACNLAGVDYKTYMRIQAYMPVPPLPRSE